MYFASSDARNSIARAISSGSRSLPNGDGLLHTTEIVFSDVVEAPGHDVVGQDGVYRDVMACEFDGGGAHEARFCDIRNLLPRRANEPSAIGKAKTCGDPRRYNMEVPGFTRWRCKVYDVAPGRQSLCPG